jgi:hypothetical protein
MGREVGCVCACARCAYLPCLWRHIALVAEERDDCVGGRVSPHLVQPLGHVLEGLGGGDVVHEDHPVRTAVVVAHDRAEAVLPCRVPDLQLHAL